MYIKHMLMLLMSYPSVKSSVFTDAFYDIITVGAPAAHFQGFKCGGLQRLLSRYETDKKR